MRPARLLAFAIVLTVACALGVGWRAATSGLTVRGGS